MCTRCTQNATTLTNKIGPAASGATRFNITTLHFSNQGYSKKCLIACSMLNMCVPLIMHRFIVKRLQGSPLVESRRLFCHPVLGLTAATAHLCLLSASTVELMAALWILLPPAADADFGRRRRMAMLLVVSLLAFPRVITGRWNFPGADDVW